MPEYSIAERLNAIDKIKCGKNRLDLSKEMKISITLLKYWEKSENELRKKILVNENKNAISNKKLSPLSPLKRKYCEEEIRESKKQKLMENEIGPVPLSTEKNRIETHLLEDLKMIQEDLALSDSENKEEIEESNEKPKIRDSILENIKKDLPLSDSGDEEEIEEPNEKPKIRDSIIKNVEKDLAFSDSEDEEKDKQEINEIEDRERVMKLFGSHSALSDSEDESGNEIFPFGTNEIIDSEKVEKLVEKNLFLFDCDYGNQNGKEQNIGIDKTDDRERVKRLTEKDSTISDSKFEDDAKHFSKSKSEQRHQRPIIAHRSEGKTKRIKEERINPTKHSNHNFSPLIRDGLGLFDNYQAKAVPFDDDNKSQNSNNWETSFSIFDDIKWANIPEESGNRNNIFESFDQDMKSNGT